MDGGCTKTGSTKIFLGGISFFLACKGWRKNKGGRIIPFLFFFFIALSLVDETKCNEMKKITYKAPNPKKKVQLQLQRSFLFPLMKRDMALLTSDFPPFHITVILLLSLGRITEKIAKKKKKTHTSSLHCSHSHYCRLCLGRSISPIASKETVQSYNSGRYTLPVSSFPWSTLLQEKLTGMKKILGRSEDFRGGSGVHSYLPSRETTKIF